MASILMVAQHPAYERMLDLRSLYQGNGGIMFCGEDQDDRPTTPSTAESGASANSPAGDCVSLPVYGNRKQHYSLRMTKKSLQGCGSEDINLHPPPKRGDRIPWASGVPERRGHRRHGKGIHERLVEGEPFGVYRRVYLAPGHGLRSEDEDV